MLNVGQKVIPLQIKDQCKNGEFWEIDLIHFDKKKKEWMYCIDDLQSWFTEEELELV
ncbi:MAG: hypothetical protein ABS939_13745 [Psychrobacillus sp.]